VNQYSFFLGDVCWFDVLEISKKTHFYSLADQLYRATGSISANIAEGYSKNSGRDQARFYEYALGSARESRDWYFKARRIFAGDVYDHRNELLTMVIKLLLTMIPNQRKATAKETTAFYGTDSNSVTDQLLTQIPFPKP